MPAIVGVAEFIGCCLIISAIAWLRRLRGAPRVAHDFGVRYVVPVLVAISVVLLISLGVDAQRSGAFHPDSSPQVAGMALGLSVVLAILVVWLAVEVRRFSVSRVHRSSQHRQ